MENQRIRLSKTMLKSALLELLQKKPLGKISIREICETAQINRTTFYKHYGSQADLLDEIEREFLARVGNRLELVLSSAPNAVAAVLKSLYEQRETFRVLTASIPNREFADHFFSLPAVDAIFRNLMSASGGTERQARYAREFIFHGTFAVLCSWLGDDDPRPVSEVAEALEFLKERFAS